MMTEKLDDQTKKGLAILVIVGLLATGIILSSTRDSLADDSECLYWELAVLDMMQINKEVKDLTGGSTDFLEEIETYNGYLRLLSNSGTPDKCEQNWFFSRRNFKVGIERMALAYEYQFSYMTNKDGNANYWGLKAIHEKEKAVYEINQLVCPGLVRSPVRSIFSEYEFLYEEPYNCARA
tara:strand:+ start:89 stop:628 length:540 start_codon:yes stop_codon:yes gene_type:complete